MASTPGNPEKAIPGFFLLSRFLRKVNIKAKKSGLHKQPALCITLPSTIIFYAFINGVAIEYTSVIVKISSNASLEALKIADDGIPSIPSKSSKFIPA